MHPRLRVPLILVSALSFSYLFFEAFPGINWLIFNTIIIALSFVIDPVRITRLRVLAAAGLWFSSAFFVLHSSGWPFFVSILSLAVFSGITAEPHYRSYALSAIQSCANGILSSFVFLSKVFLEQNSAGRWVSRSFRYYYLAIPLIVVFVFIAIYSRANPFFDAYLGTFSQFISSGWNWMFSQLNMKWLMLLILGGVVSIFALMPVEFPSLLQLNAAADEHIRRTRRPGSEVFGMMGLKKEFRSALLLLVALNALLLFFNVLDLWHVWINFEWNGDYLKQFVHEGTWLLVVSILISIAIVLFYFRANLNFFPKSRMFRYLTYAWLAQNAFLALSVVVRNLHYIEYFSLAYKRIAVMFFLGLVLVGLFTVYHKVRYKKSKYYLLRTNSMALFIALLLSCSVNWDVFITRYNFAHHATGYVHFDFMAQMDFAALPYMDYDLETLKAIEEDRNLRYPVEPGYMDAEDFYRQIERKKQGFIEGFEEKSWKEWTFANYQVYRLLCPTTSMDGT